MDWIDGIPLNPEGGTAVDRSELRTEGREEAMFVAGGFAEVR